MIFAGPGKTDDELSFAVAKQIGAIHVESVAEATRLSAVAERAGRTVSIALRVNPAGDAQGGAMRMGGQAAPFGIDEECLADAVDAVSDLPGLNLRGVHLFTGTQILDADVLIGQCHKATDIAEQVARRIRQPLHTIDFGGGLGIPYFGHEQRLELARLQGELRQVVAGVKRRPLLADARLVLEPGRSLVGEAGIYVARVIEVKRSRSKTFVITDGGMHHHLAASGNLGQTIKRNYPVALVNKLNQPADQVVDVVGPLCTPLDVLARSTTLPVATPGDLVGIFQSGAYARSASPLGFLSHPSPPEIWVDNGQHRAIRVRGNREDSLAGQAFNPPEHNRAHARSETRSADVEKITDDMFDQIYASFLDGDPFLTKDDWRPLFSRRDALDDCCGYALLDRSRIVGILGMLFSDRTVNGVSRRFCNLFSWYVNEHRGKSLMLMRPALRLHDCTLTDLTPTSKVRDISQRLGFRPLDSRLRVLFPVARSHIPNDIDVITDRDRVRAMLNDEDSRLFDDHQLPGIGHLVVQSASDYCYVVYSDVARYRIPYAHVHYFSNREQFQTHTLHIRDHITRSTNTKFVAVNDRQTRGMILRPSVRLPMSKPHLFRPAGVQPEDIDTLYTEVALLRLSTLLEFQALSRFLGRLRPWRRADARQGLARRNRDARS